MRAGEDMQYDPSCTFYSLISLSYLPSLPPQCSANNTQNQVTHVHTPTYYIRKQSNTLGDKMAFHFLIQISEIDCLDSDNMIGKEAIQIHGPYSAVYRNMLIEMKYFGIYHFLQYCKYKSIFEWMLYCASKCFKHQHAELQVI